MSDPYDGCTKVSSRCPVEGTVYGYYPNLAANVIMLVVFGTCAAAQVILGIKYRVQTFAILVCLGCIGEVGGYVGRVMMHSNPWSDGGFTIQVLLLIVSPSLLAAALYITLKHLLAHFGPEYSKLKPTLYTWIFITCDAVGFAMQLAGGGVQASATKGKEGEDRSKMGNKIMIAGIIFQAVTMGFCALLGVDYAIRRRKARAVRQGADYYQSPPRKKGFTFYLVCSMTAFVLILIRCIYRIPEMAGGWGNPMMRKEAEFMILDAAMISCAAILMTVAFPGAFFPEIRSRDKAKLVLMSEDGEELVDTPGPR